MSKKSNVILFPCGDDAQNSLQSTKQKQSEDKCDPDVDPWGDPYDDPYISKCKRRKSDDSSSSKENASCEYVADSHKLTLTELKEKYQGTYNSWRNMKSRRKSHGAIIAKEFMCFRSFLRIVGPRPGKKYTLDRLDNNDPEYAPGKVAWKDKRDQANNRSSTIYLEYNGVRKPLPEWARDTDQNLATLRKRRERGWTDPEVIYGRGKISSDADDLNSLSYRPWPGYKAEREEGERRYLKYKKPDDNRFDFYIRTCNKMKRQLIKEKKDMLNQCGYEGSEKQVADYDNQIDKLKSMIEKAEKEYTKWWKNVGRKEYGRP